VLARPGNGKRGNAQQEQFRHGFGNALAEQESGGLVDQYAIPGPGRPLFEASAANLKKSSPAVDAGKRDRGPLPSTGAERTAPSPRQPKGGCDGDRGDDVVFVRPGTVTCVNVPIRGFEGGKGR
jgi:hypothetical protein